MESSRIESFERQYAQSLKRILKDGVRKNNRTNIDTISVEHQYFHINNVADNFPRIKGKMVYPKLALKELIWMLEGRTDADWLHKYGVHYWDEWMKKNEFGDLTIGKSYGYQYRNFNHIDQLEKAIIDMLIRPESRRIIINLWNLNDLSNMVLPPCMYDYHFSLIPVDKSSFGGTTYKMNLHAHIRSNDLFLGCPYDVMFCAWFVYVICKYLNSQSYDNEYIPNDIHYTADDYHLYTNHIEQAEQYLKNVEENKFGIIDSKCKIIDNIEIDKSPIDTFLETIENNFPNIKISGNFDQSGNEIEFKYPKITATVAV